MRRTSVLAAAAFALVFGVASVHPAPARGGLITIAVAVDDSYSVAHDRTLTRAAPGVLGNDLNVDLLGGTSVDLVSGVSHGTLALGSDGGFTYTPAAGFVGTDSFTYRLRGLLTTPADVTLTVTNQAPRANADTYQVAAGRDLRVSAPGILANDSDPDGDALSVEADESGVSGSLDVDPDGGFVYSPGGGFKGSATFRYRVWDGVAWSSFTTVTLTAASPTPTPAPTPAPTPTPVPTPSPLLPLPSLPLPSLAVPSLPLPSLPGSSLLPLPLPSATVAPTPLPLPLPPGPIVEPPGESSEPAPSRRPSDDATAAPGETAPTPLRDAPSADAVAAIPGSSDDAGGGPAAPQAAAIPIGPGGLGVHTGSPSGDGDLAVTLDGGLGLAPMWFVPAAAVSGPGLLVILWVALQLAGGIAWLPAARRLRGEEERGAIVRR